jgi:hypothetical protein
MLRLHTQAFAPTKNPRCRLADEGARRDELSSADTLSYDENGPCAHAATIAPREPQSILVDMRLAIRKDPRAA